MISLKITLARISIKIVFIKKFVCGSDSIKGKSPNNNLPLSCTEQDYHVKLYFKNYILFKKHITIFNRFVL